MDGEKKKKIFAFAVNEEKVLSETLGKASFFLFLAEDLAEHAFLPAKAFLPPVLKQEGAEVLFCKKLGNCACMLLESKNIKVVGGCVKNRPQEILKEYLDNTLERETEFLCSSFSRSCGECPGKF